MTTINLECICLNMERAKPIIQGKMDYFLNILKWFPNTPDFITIYRNKKKMHTLLNANRNRNSLRSNKLGRQKKWLCHLEEYITEEINKIQKNTYKFPSLRIITFPEFFFSDINDRGKQYTPDKRANPNYSIDRIMPIYKPVAEQFISGLLSIDHNLAKLTRDTNTICFAGTIPWKEIHFYRTREVIYNTLPVFYKGKCYFLWDKVCTSSIDGIDLSNPKKTNKIPSQFRTSSTHSMLLPNRKNFLPQHSFDTLIGRTPNPVFTIPIGPHKITIRVDICLDYAIRNNQPISLLPPLLTPAPYPNNKPPEIHVLITAGMTANRGSSDTTGVFIRCDSSCLPNTPNTQVTKRVFNNTPPYFESVSQHDTHYFKTSIFDIYYTTINVGDTVRSANYCNSHTHNKRRAEVELPDPRLMKRRK